MIGRGFILWAALAGVAGWAMFQVKYAVIDLEERLAAENRQILAHQEAIHVLKAEWTYLNEPARLARLVARHLDLVPAEGAQLATFATFDSIASPVPAAAKTSPVPKLKPLLARSGR